MVEYRITAVLPCLGRFERTKRMIECILSQTASGWEAFVIGDGCPVFQGLMDSGYLEACSVQAHNNGNKLHFSNLEKNHGGYGFHIMNQAVQLARGKYFIWLANDDVILPDHFKNYLEIEKTDLDYMYFNTYLEPAETFRDAQPFYCQIGHAELIVRTEFLKTIQPHQGHYGHDWDVIEEIIEKGKGAKSETTEVTYRVRSIPNIGCVDTIN